MHDSMINPPITELLDKVDNRYRLVTVTSKRARQVIAKQEVLLSEEDQKLKGIKDVSDKPLTVAINEVDKDLVTFEEVIPEGK